MKKLSKVSAMLSLVIAASMAFAACGSTDSYEEESVADSVEESVVESVIESTPVSDSSEESTDGVGATEIADALANTVWAGMDDEYTCFVMAFTDEKIVLAADDDSSIEGYWGVKDNDPTIYIFKDSDLTDLDSQIPWSYDSENQLMILNEKVYMTQTDYKSFDDVTDALSKMAVAKKAQDYLQNTYWAVASADSSSIMAFSLKGNSSYMAIYSNNELTEADLTWAMDYDYLSFYNNNNELVLSYNWDMAEDGSTLKLTDSEGNTMDFVKLTDEEATNIGEYLGSLANAS